MKSIDVVRQTSQEQKTILPDASHKEAYTRYYAGYYTLNQAKKEEWSKRLKLHNN